MGKKSSPAPDYTPVANASAEATRVSEALAREQMAEARRQYEDQKAVAKPIVDAQLEVMRQGIDQGKDYYDYMKEKQRPIEDALQKDALKDNSGRDQAELDAIKGANETLAGKTADIGNRQKQAGMDYATGLRTELGGIASTFADRSDAAMSRADADIARSDALIAASLAKMEAAAGRAAGASAGIRSKSGQYEGQINSDIDLFTGGNEGIRNRFGKDIQQESDEAMADARAGQAQAQGAALRQALRLGLDPSTVSTDLSTAQASQIAAATNGARRSATEKFRGIVGQGIGMRQNLMNTATNAEIAAANTDVAAAGLGVQAAGAGVNAAASRASLGLNRANSVTSNAAQRAALDATTSTSALGAQLDASDKGFAAEGNAASILAMSPQQQRQLRMQNDATQTAKMMDIAGMYRGLSGASSGAYGMAVGAGNSANGNNAAAGNTLMQNTGAANQLQMGGRQLAMQGLTNILNNQTSYANANQGESFGSILGGIGGAAAGVAKIWPSDRRLKVGIELIGRDERTGLNLYEFAYKWAPEFRYRGVMADEVLAASPDAVIVGPDGTMRVDYARLGLEMTEA